MSRGPLLIVGASGRAAAVSALRAGYLPHVIDLFADADTQKLAPTLRCSLQAWPHGLVELARQVPPMPWLYTGGIENYPQIINEISQSRKLVGNSAAVLTEVRDPLKLAVSIREIGGLFPETIVDERDADPKKRWLVKTTNSAGGLGVRDPRTAAVPAASHHHHSILNNNPPSGGWDGRGPKTYLQEYIRGEPLSAAYDGTTLLGVSRQLCGTEWLHAPPYHYSGNVRHDDRNYQDEFTRLGQHLASTFHLVGRWGLDAIATNDGLWCLEVNPRSTASMELFEHSVPDNICIGIGKAIYYAAMEMTFPASGPWDESLRNCTNISILHDFADIPAPGTVIAPGQPVLTFFARSTSLFLLLFNMKEIAANLDRLFGVTP